MIGQFGKNDLYKDEFKGFKLMEYCLNTLLDGQMRLGGRLVMIECKNISYLIEFYEQFGFKKLEKDYKKDELLQFIKILNQDELIIKSESTETE